MPTLKAILHPKYEKDGTTTHRLALRVTENRRRSYLLLGHNIDPKHWNSEKESVRKSHLKHKQLNRLIRKKYDEIEDVIFESKSFNKHLTAKQIIDQVKRNKKGVTFFTLAEEHINELTAAGKYARTIPAQSRYSMFRKFLNRDVSFQEIDENLLRKYKAWLQGVRGVSERTCMNYFIAIRTLYNRAIAGGVVEQKYYPFGKGKIQIKFPQTIKIGLEANEIIDIENLELEKGTTIWHTRNVFLFSFYFAGIRISDVLRMRWKDFKNDRLYYKMNKNNKVDSLKIPAKVYGIIESYKEDKKSEADFIFPELKKAKKNDKKDEQVKIKTAIKKFNHHLTEIAKLAEIDKNITTHIARHSFGNIAGDKVSPQMLQKLYRHTNLSTTIGYQGNFIHKDADDALGSVVDF